MMRSLPNIGQLINTGFREKLLARLLEGFSLEKQVL